MGGFTPQIGVRNRADESGLNYLNWRGGNVVDGPGPNSATSTGVQPAFVSTCAGLAVSGVAVLAACEASMRSIIICYMALPCASAASISAWESGAGRVVGPAGRNIGMDGPDTGLLWGGFGFTLLRGFSTDGPDATGVVWVQTVLGVAAELSSGAIIVIANGKTILTREFIS